MGNDMSIVHSVFPGAGMAVLCSLTFGVSFHLSDPVYVSPCLQVVRNPFDIIATTYLYFEGGAELRSALRANPNMTVETDERVLDCVVERHVREVMSLTYLANSQLYSILRVYIEDMVMNPKEEILNLCKFLELECSQDYIDNCAAAIFPSSSKSRYKLQWTQRQSNRVIELINATPYLRYRYPSGF